MVNSFLGVLFSVAGLGLIAIQMCLSIGWIKRSTRKETIKLENWPLPDGVVKIIERIINTTGWMGFTALILIYVSCAFLDVSLFGS